MTILLCLRSDQYPTVGPGINKGLTLRCHCAGLNGKPLKLYGRPRRLRNEYGANTCTVYGNICSASHVRKIFANSGGPVYSIIEQQKTRTTHVSTILLLLLLIRAAENVILAEQIGRVRNTVVEFVGRRTRVW